MVSFINDATIDRVKDDGNIVDIISSYVQLNKSGANYVGLCPFHNEKTPSFTVSQSKQFFHCFGCGESGDSIAFIMKIENLDFIDATKLLADRLAIPIEEKKVDNQRTRERERAYEINKTAARFFYKNLINNPQALKYLEKRQIDPRTIRRFGLGFAPDTWDSLYNYLVDKKYKSEEIEKIGLIGKKSGNNGYYDRFRNRIIFPIINTRGNIIGFGGRILDDSMPKYLNSKESIVFHKRNNLFGLNLVHKHSNREKILLVEGYMDVIALFAKGMNFTVASLGTALTNEQVKLLRRYGNNIYICYDSDQAGSNATLKAIDILLEEDIDPKIILLPEGMDPDDYIKKYGMLEFEKLFVKSLNHIDYKIFINKKKYDLSNTEDNIQFTIKIADIIRKLKSPVEQDVYINKISQDTGISKEAIEKEIKSKVEKKSNKKRNLKYNQPTIKPVTSEIPSGYLKAELELIKLAIEDKDFFETINDRLGKEDFSSNGNQELFQIISSEYEFNSKLDMDKLVNKFIDSGIEQNLINTLTETKLDYNPTQIDKILVDLMSTVVINKLEKQRREIIKNIENIDKQSETKELRLKLINLNNELKSIRQE